MIRQAIFLIFSLGIIITCKAGNPNKLSQFNWENAGTDNFFFNEQVINFQTHYECDFRGNEFNDIAIKEAIGDLGPKGGVVYLKAGVYLFSEPIIVPSNVLIKGEGLNTVLAFDMNEAKDAIQFNGKLSKVEYELSGFSKKGTKLLKFKNTTGLATGDLLKIWIPNSTLTTSDWAKGSISQLVRITSVKGKAVELENNLRLSLTSENVRVAKVNPIKNAGIGCLQIIRSDQTETQTSNIRFNYAENCFVKGVQSDYCNFAHVEINNSYKTQVSSSYFRFGHDYGRGGKAYGVVLQFGSSDCLVEDNIFTTLRHSILLQAGSNGNVIAYNYSVKPKWAEENFPENAAGDIVLHGNYPFANLFEGNIAQNIIVDASHGANGPENIFLNNTSEQYGFFINPNAADSQVIIDNKITNRDFLKGNYLVHGKGHYEFGNKVKNKFVPANTKESEYESFYNKANKFKASGANRILAEKRYNEKQYTDCTVQVEQPNNAESNAAYTSIDDRNGTQISLYPNPTNDFVNIDFDGNVVIRVFDAQGKMILHTTEKLINVLDWEKGTYFFRIKDIDNNITTFNKVLVN